MADAHEAFWQHVQQEASEELVHLQTHETLLVVISRVAPAERDLVLDKRHEPVIGDRDTVRVAAEIAESVLRSAEGALRIYNPILAEEQPQERRERFRLGERLLYPMEAEFAFGPSFAQAGHELAPEHAT